MRRLLTFSIAAVLSLSTASLAFAADPGEVRERDAAKVGRAKAAEILGRTPDTVRSLAYGSPVTSVGGRRYWTGVFRGKGDSEAFVAVDLASGEAMDAAAYQAKVERAIGRQPRVTPPARARIDEAKRRGTSPLLAYVLPPVDYEPAVRAVKAAFDIYVNCSTYEGISLTILEEMETALPLVARAVGGNTEVVIDHEKGLLVRPQAQAIATAV